MDEQEIFARALEIDTNSERAALLDELCSESQLRSRVERLLELSENSDHFMECPAAGIAASELAPTLATERTGDWIGPYKLLEQIGEGGMGVVYMAAQSQPVKRTVALKVIKPGMDTNQVIARFESERQALAMMEHSGIARVLDAGETESGRPYFVMELVRGVPITDYCKREHLDTRARLLLFMDVCRAVQHAHLKGIIHRDVKPSNVMITRHDGEPIVKMIDFGVAKAINTQLTERTLFTNYSQMIGTPLYMSPEQAELSGLDVDTRSDIYSLGVLLYELLTGTTPFDEQRLREVGYDEMRRIIREEDPPKPSTRVSTLHAAGKTVSDKRSSDPRRISEMLRGELDWIVIKAMEKKRARRYQSASDFSADVDRYLNGDPVQACPPSKTYLLKKVLKKHRTSISTAALFGILLVAGTVIAVVSAVRAERAEAQADREKSAAEVKAAVALAINDFLNNDVLGQASPLENANRDLSLREALDRASRRIEGRFRQQPLVEAEIRTTLGSTYNQLGEHRTAQTHFRKAYTLREGVLGSDAPETLRSAFQLAALESKLTDDAAEARLLEQLLEKQKVCLPPNDPETLKTMAHLALSYSRQEQFEKSEALFAVATDRLRQTLGPDDPRTLDGIELQAIGLQEQQQFGAAQRLYSELLVSRRRAFGNAHDHTQKTRASAAEIELRLGRNEEALKIFRELVAVREQTLRKDHPSLISARAGMANALFALREFDEAEEVLLKNLGDVNVVFGEDSVWAVSTKESLVALYLERHDAAEAQRLLIEIHEMQEREGRDVSETSMYHLRMLAEIYSVNGNMAPATELLFRRLAESQSRMFGDRDKRTISSLRLLAMPLAQQQNVEALELLVKTVGERVGFDHADTIFCRMNLAAVSLAQGKHQQAERQLSDLYDVARREHGDDQVESLRVGALLANAMQKLGRAEQAEQLARDILDRRHRRFGDNHVETFQSIADLAAICADLDRTMEAVELYDRALRIRAGLYYDTQPDSATVLAGLTSFAEKLEGVQNWPEARVARECAHKWTSEIHGERKQIAVDALQALANVSVKAEDWETAWDALSRELSLRQAKEPDADETHECGLRAAGVLVSLERFAEAESMLQSVHGALQSGEEPQFALLQRCRQQFVDLYTASNNDEAVAVWAAKQKAHQSE